MAAENVKILVTQYDWTGSASTPQESSIFSDNAAVITRDGYDLMDYLLDDTLPISWRFEYIKDGYSAPKLLGMGSQADFLVSDVGEVMSTYFRRDLATPFIKWKVQIKYDNVLVHEGWISPDGIEYAENAGTGSDTNSLVIRVRDVLTEIKNYFTGVRLKSNNDINWTGIHASGSRTAKFGAVLAQNFPGVAFTIPSSISDWDVMETPQLYLPPGNNIDLDEEMWCTSYERVYTKGENRWDWFRRICTDMGWVMFSLVENGTLKIGIKDRADSDLPLHTLDVNRMTEYRRSKELNNNDFEMVVLINGAMDGGNAPFTLQGNYYPELKGARLIILSNNYEENYECRHWDRIERASNDEIRFYWDNHALFKYASEDENVFRIYKLTGTNSSLTIELFEVPQVKLLKIDGGDASPYAMKLVADTGLNEGHTVGSTVTGHYDLIYTGCYAEMLTKDGTQYNDYIKTEKFRANFEPFLSDMERHVIRYTQDALLLSPNYTIGGGTPLNGHIWDIASMEIDLIKETTSFELISQR